MKIGDKQVIYQQTMLIPDETDASFDVTIGTLGPTPFILRFSPKAEEPQVTWRSEGKTIKIEFSGWANPLGTAFSQPQALGTFDGVGELFFSVFHHRVGTANRLDLQLLVREPK